MENKEQIKQLVRNKYSEIASQSREENLTGCCGAGCGCSTIDEALLAEDYESLEGYLEDADLGLGCGLPTKFAAIKEGDTVIDLGSGAGNDAFVARSITKQSGKIIGIDFTEKMIEKARANAEKLGFNNVEFRLGDIENLPVSDNIADVVVSNCVFNLVPDKEKAFNETFRILKPGGHFSISDVLIDGNLSKKLGEIAELYVGCISGAIQKKEYLDIIRQSGFTNVQIQKEKNIVLPDEFLLRYLSPDELSLFRKSDTRILSVTVYGEKKSNKTEKEACCEPGCCGN